MISLSKLSIEPLFRPYKMSSILWASVASAVSKEASTLLPIRGRIPLTTAFATSKGTFAVRRELKRFCSKERSVPELEREREVRTC